MRKWQREVWKILQKHYKYIKKKTTSHKTIVKNVKLC